MENSNSYKGRNRDDFSLKLQYSYISSTPQIIVENDHTVHKKFERSSPIVCRLCANVVDKPIYLFTDNDNGFNLADKINSCLPITVKKNDMLPKQLCSNCIEKLHECFQFYGTCISAEKTLIAENTHPSKEGYVNNTDINNIEKKICSNSYNCPLCVEGTLQIVGTTIKNEIENDAISSNDNISSIVSTRVSSNSHYLTQDGINRDANSITRQHHEFFSELGMPIDRKSQEIQQEIRSNSYMCRICNKMFDLIEMLLIHCKIHSKENFFPCVLCYNINFDNESQLDTHFYYTHQMLNCYDTMEIKPNFDSDNEFITSNQEIENKIILTDINFPLQINEESSFKTNNTSEIFEGETLLYNGYLVPEKKEICGICGMQFSTDAMLLTHVNSTHVTNNIEEVASTSKSFEFGISLNQHNLKEHDIGKSFQCDFCKATFGQLNQVKSHIKQFHEEQFPIEMQICYQCSECKCIFPDVNQVSEHSALHEQCTLSCHYIRNVLKCEYCDLCFMDREDFKQHLSQHIGELPYECIQCNLYFESYYKINEHKKTHEENSALIQNSDQFSIPVFYLCEFCGRTFEHWQSLYIHRYKSHLHGRSLANDGSSGNPHENLTFTSENGQSHLCEVCGMIFESQSTLTKHRRQEHPQTSKYRCPECGKVLANLTGLIIHRRLHTGEKPFVCDVCGKSFHQSSGMYTHRRTHTRECPYRCEYCGQAYNVKGDLDNHRRAKHTKERPFKCETCEKTFLTSSVFYQHRILHTGVRKYKCMYCDKSFARWNALRLHIRTHTGEKPYICYVCQRGFAQKGDMKKHMKTQHNIHEVPENT